MRIFNKIITWITGWENGKFYMMIYDKSKRTIRERDDFNIKGLFKTLSEWVFNQENFDQFSDGKFIIISEKIIGEASHGKNYGAVTNPIFYWYATKNVVIFSIMGSSGLKTPIAFIKSDMPDTTFRVIQTNNPNTDKIWRTYPPDGLKISPEYIKCLS